jgi:uncharacterized membrane protein YphA (DoxX/SURF4 family)
MAGTATPATRPFATWPKDALRIAFGIVWLIDAVLKWLPGFKSNYVSMTNMAGQGQPSWLHPWFSFWATLQDPRAAFFVYLAAVIETLIAVALIAGFARKLSYILAAVFSLLIWATAEGFGGPYTSGATDIGTSIIYVVVFLGLLTLAYYAGPDRYSVDHYLEKKVSWWWIVAELRRPATAQPVAAAQAPAYTEALPPADVPQPRPAGPTESAQPTGKLPA